MWIVLLKYQTHNFMWHGKWNLQVNINYFIICHLKSETRMGKGKEIVTAWKFLMFEVRGSDRKWLDGLRYNMKKSLNWFSHFHILSISTLLSFWGATSAIPFFQLPHLSYTLFPDEYYITCMGWVLNNVSGPRRLRKIIFFIKFSFFLIPPLSTFLCFFFFFQPFSAAAPSFLPPQNKRK